MAFNPKNLTYDAHGVPYLRATEIEAVAYQLLETYDSAVFTKAQFTPVAEIIERLGERTQLKSMIEDLGFRDGAKILGKVTFARRVLHLDQSLLAERKAQFRFTAAHEIGHWVLHRHRPLRLKTNNAPVEELADDEQSLCRLDQRSPREWVEYQANVFAASLVMPRKTFHEELVRAQKQIGIVKNFGIVFVTDKSYSSQDWSQIISLLSSKFDVSRTSVKVRLNTLRLVVDEGTAKGKSLSDVLRQLTP